MTNFELCHYCIQRAIRCFKDIAAVNVTVPSGLQMTLSPAQTPMQPPLNFLKYMNSDSKKIPPIFWIKKHSLKPWYFTKDSGSYFCAFLSHLTCGFKQTQYLRYLQITRPSVHSLTIILPHSLIAFTYFNPYTANVDNMASSYQC